METRQYTVYKFNELSKEAKKRAIEKWYKREDYPFLTEDLLIYLEELDTLKIFSSVELQYSLSYCQGDGLSFSASIDVGAWLKNKGYSQDRIDALNEHIYRFTSIGNKGWYCYASESQIEWEDNGNSIDKSVEHEIESIRKDIAKYYLYICKRLEECGYSILDYRMNEEEFNEYCEYNEYMFTENGDID